MEICSLGIRELQTQIVSGRQTRHSIAEAFAARIERINPIINTYDELRIEAALAEAAEADLKFGSHLNGSLDGVPISVKDSFAVAGLVTAGGIEAFAKRATKNDTSVERLIGAGGIILGHGSVPDLCIRWNTLSSRHGKSLNPHDLSKSVGGSSGGDAANVAAGMAVASIGSDLGGSVRVPAVFCGIYGLRPTSGMIPNARLMNINPPGPISKAMCSSGPMARTVDDLKVCFDVLTNGSPDDCHYPKVLLSPEDSRPTVAVLRHETGAMLSHEIESKLDETIGVLRESGLKVLENVLPDLAEAPEVWANILGTELLQFVIPNVGKQINPGALVHIQDMFGPFNLGPDLAPYRQAWLKRIALMEILETTMEDYSVILSPVAGMPVPPVDFDELIPFQETQKLFASMRSVMWVNLFGLPAISLPNGMQLVGRRYSEATLFRIASLIEKHLPVVQIADPWNFASRI